MKKIISVLFLSIFLVSCTKVKQYEDFDTYQEMDVIFEEWKVNREKTRYYFLDCRSISERKKYCHPYFEFIENKQELKNTIDGAKKNSPIILMGQNAEDQRPYEFREYLIGKGYTNVAIYRLGFENYLTKEGFEPKTNCSIDCGCN